jgi:sodium-independent sulfate anion transporter 11
MVPGRLGSWSVLSLLIMRATLTDLTGITIGAVVVPQGMAYAGLANLEPQFGLYSSFMGVLLYWLFATSKDITIGVSTNSDAVLTEVS